MLPYIKKCLSILSKKSFKKIFKQNLVSFISLIMYLIITLIITSE